MDKQIINGFPFIKYTKETYGEEETIQRAAAFMQWMEKRRTVRDFSDKHVPEKVIEDIIMTASTAPSGAHKQPWTFCAISNPELKKQIREAAEAEEYESYNNRMPPEWLEDLLPLQTDWHKEFLEIAPWLIVVFKRIYEPGENGKKKNNYYVQESVGLAAGFLLTAIHNAGLVALTHTPSPMNFLAKILNRPEHEKPFLLIPVGYPADECLVPDLVRRSLDDVAVFYQ
ncbi:MAG: nitroreductase family protein [Chitinophagaceae bacterium]|nr:nitroreductase family protein [Chitinophagaceae bacterium]MCB9046285.1 nitroreductase family protein [Chitinophagales bacterium]